jgi:hypothetical protein
MSFSITVIPAKAGIPLLLSSSAAGQGSGIPAFGGMTAEGQAR